MKSLIYISFALVFSPQVFCGNDLCKNGGKVDSIAYIYDRKQWFFTSGGYYWVEKNEELPPKVKGEPLPGGFKKGEVAIYRNTLDACNNGKHKEKEIYVFEKTDSGVQYIVYDVRSNSWTQTEPKNAEEDHIFSRARVDWNNPIDAAFIFEMTNLVVIQGTKYSVIDFKPFCDDPNAWGEAKKSRELDEFNVQGLVDATTRFGKEENLELFYLFQNDIWWDITIKLYVEAEGQLVTKKDSIGKDVLTEFFKFPKKCESNESPESPVSEETPNQPNEPKPEPEEPESTNADPGEADKQPDDKPEEDSGNGIWIPITVVVVIVIIIAIVLCVCLAVRKKKSTDNTEAAKPMASRSGAPKSSRAGTSKVGSKVGSRVDSTVGSKVGPKATTNMGSSPSTMSVRSQTNLKPTSSAVKSSASKK